MNPTPSLLTSCCLAAALLWPGVAPANPVVDMIVRVRQVPSTRHVQITWAQAQKKPGLVTPTQVARDGEPLYLKFVPMEADYQGNPGSGIWSLLATQTCDCDVELGPHIWTLAAPSQDWKGKASLEVVADMPEPPVDAGGGEAGADASASTSPWNIPEPAQMQGIDCAQACAAGGLVAPPDTVGGTGDGHSGAPDVGAGGAGASDVTSSGGSGGGTKDAAEGGGGSVGAEDGLSGGGSTGGGSSDGNCGANPTTGSRAGLLLLLLAVGALVLTRRSARG